MLFKIIYSFVAGILLAFAGCAGAAENLQRDMTLTIYHYKVPCMGEGVQLCYLVKKDNGSKEFFYDEIEGFNYEWGFNYTVSIEKKAISGPMSDASSIRYKIKKIIKKEKAPAGETFELPLRVEDQQLIESKNGACNYLGKEIQTAAFSCNELKKASSAIFRHRQDKAGLVLVKMK